MYIYIPMIWGRSIFIPRA